MEMELEQFENMWKVMRENRFDIIDDSRSEYTCIICKQILINACSAQCGCRFCLDCIKDYLKYVQRKCPGQSQFCEDDVINIDTDIQINRLVNKRISKLSAKCPNIDCQSQMELSLMADHLRTCGTQPEMCPYLIIGCEEQRSETVRVRDHLSNEIHPHTKLLMAWISNSQNESKALRSDMDQLKEKMRSEGEKTQRIIQELWKRERENSKEIKILNEEMCRLKNSNKSTNEELDALKKNHLEQVAQFERMVKSQNQEIQELKREIQNQNQEIEAFQERYLHSEEIPHQDEEITLNDVSNESDLITDESTRSIQATQEMVVTSNCGVFNWKIDGWSGKVKNKTMGKYICSNPFESHSNGYNIRLDMYFGLNRLNIYFSDMRGPSDDTLTGPLDRVVELSIIDQQTGLAYKTQTIKCFEYPNEAGFQKSVSGRNDSCLSIAYSEIETNPSLCQNDQIWIQFSSIPSDNPKSIT